MQKEKFADLVWDHDKVAHKNFIDNLAPIVLFTYNRLEHTKRTIEALKQNIYAENSELYIYSDAPKNETVRESVEAVRDFLHKVEGFKKIHIIKRQENWGLARNIIEGVTSIVNKYGRIIVLEDDIVTSRFFLKYMNDALEIYENEERVMNVSGNCWVPDSGKSDLPETFFLPWNACWGWGTWKSRWKYFKRNPADLVEKRFDFDLYRFNFYGAQDVFSQVVQNYKGIIKTWAVFWDISIFQKQGLVLYCNHDLCKNIGMDGSGENCGVTEIYTNEIQDKETETFGLNIEVSKDAENVVVLFFESVHKKRSIFKRVMEILKTKGFGGLVRKIKHRIVQ